VHASGCVSGTVRYGSLLVSEGGVVSGDIAAIDGKGDSQGALFAGYPSARTTTGKLAGVEHVAA
jgi:cytoskeletal protein CcmA (bactofilin family)